MPRRRSRADHALSAAAMRHRPGMWIEVGSYSSAYSAKSAGSWIRNGRMGAYTPLGAFETRTAPLEYGTALYARYIGDTK